MKVAKVFLRICLIVFIILAGVYLYSPIGVGLSPFDNDPFVIALSLANGMAIIALLFFGNKAISLIEGKPAPIVFPETYTGKEVKDILSGMQGSALFQEITNAVIDQMEKGGLAKDALEKSISDSFQKGSISWSKYYDVVESAAQSIVENGMAIARRLEQFNENEFFELRKVIQSGAYKEDSIPDDIQEGKMVVFKKKLGLIYELMNINERLLIKLDSLDTELVSITEKNVDHGNDLLSDINTLIEETKYYK